MQVIFTEANQFLHSNPCISMTTASKAFTVYRSSAGSGKTFTLAKEYLKLLLASPKSDDGKFEPHYFKKILAVTFTNDAANEMKERIMKVLAAWSAASNDGEDAELTDRTADDMINSILREEELPSEYPDTEWSKGLILSRAASIYRTLLHNYSDFAVSTIDSFTNRVVQAFKQDLGFAHSHEIELETAELQEEAALALQRQMREDGEQDLNKLLVEFAVRKSDEGKSWFIHRDLESFAGNLFQEEQVQVLERLKSLSAADFAKIKSGLYAYTKEIEEKAQYLANEALNLIRQHGIEAKSLAYTTKGIHGYFTKHAQGQEFLYKIQPNSYVLKTINKDLWLSAHGKKTPDQKMAISQIQDQLREHFQALENFKEEVKEQYVLARELRGHIFLLATINALSEQLEMVKESRRIIHISDFNRSINKIVEEEPVPYLYERIGDRYFHLLIDEFQDTSRMQWHNLIPLIGNALGYGAKNLVVGDAKQAIYRWRGGNADMLVNLPAVPTAATDSALQVQIDELRIHYDEQELDTNYRSLEQVVKFNNHFFSQMATHLGQLYPSLPQYYAQVEQKNLPHKKGGYVEWRMLQNTKLKKGDYEALQLVETLDTLRRLYSEGYPLKDIAILVRKNAYARTLAQFLKDSHFPVISDDSLLVGNASVVQLIVKTCRVLQQPAISQWRLELMLALQRHWCTLFPNDGWETLFEGNEGIDYLQRAVSADTSLSKYADLLAEAFKISLDLTPLRLQPVYELCETLIRHFHLGKLPTQQPYLHSFLDFVLESTGRRGNDLNHFLSYWERKANKLAVQLPAGRDAVRIMTIHRSKGLQFPVVIVPFLDWSAKPHINELLWLPWENKIEGLPNLPAVALKITDRLTHTEFAQYYRDAIEASFLDAFNLLYVAFTRAESRLYALGKLSKPLDSVEKDAEKTCSDMGQLASMYLAQLGRFDQPDDTTKWTLEQKDGTETEEKFGIWRFSDGEAPPPREQKQEEVLSTLNLEVPHTANWQYLSVRQEKLGKHETTLEDIERRQEAKAFGNILHAAFELIEYTEDIPKAVRRMLQRGEITQAQVAEMEEKMQEAVSLPPIAPYYQNGHPYRVLNEQEILLAPSAEGIGQAARPDRLLINGKEAVIIDYKTGRFSTTHQNQVKQYMWHLRQMNYTPVKGFLLYTESMEVVEVQ